MLVVAGVALVCAAVVELPGGPFLVVLLVPIIGPLIGAGWAGRRYQPGRLDPISGGVVGGILESMLASMVLSVVLKHPPEFLLIPLLAVGLFYGFVVGLIYTYGLLARSASAPPFATFGAVRKRVGTGLRDLQRARPVDEMALLSELFDEAPHLESLSATSESTAVEVPLRGRAQGGAGPDQQDRLTEVTEETVNPSTGVASRPGRSRALARVSPLTPLGPG
jgi:hypothetical protein